MTARLLVISGPAQGSTFEICGPEAFLGRQPGNQVVIPDLTLSRRHSLIFQRDDRWWIRDLGSQNGTFVNGSPIQEVLLKLGDEIAAGDSRLLLLPGPDVPGPLETSPSDGILHSTVRMRREDGFYDNPERLVQARLGSSRAGRELGALVKIGRELATCLTIDELIGAVSRMISDAIPADRAAVVVARDQESGVETHGWNNEQGPGDPVSASIPLIRRALDEVCVISSSSEPNRPGSVLVVPIVYGEKAVGVLYLESLDLVDAFDQGHVELLTSIAGFAALAIENVWRTERLEQENVQLRSEVAIEHSMVGDGEAMQSVYQLIARVAPATSTVLIRGESGTGKELAARAIHRNSPRACGPFLAVNCAVLTESLLESELFGHERGAFTGAVARKLGKFEAAHRGTLFLDEIGELAVPLQAKLLRAIQERQIERLGATGSIAVDVRLIAASNRDLNEEVRAGRFRADLFYRLNVVSLRMPALRERGGDIPMLAAYFVAKFAAQTGRRMRGLTPEVLSILTVHSWPGNVRELENVIERAVVLGSTEWVTPEDLPEELLESEQSLEGGLSRYHERLREAKTQLVLTTFQQTGGNYVETARLLGIRTNNLHRLIRNLGIKRLFAKPEDRS
jgi:transcriptional regulator with GAF, ATPase, and Fis domain